MKHRIALASDWLALSAAPVFALMAALSLAAGDGHAGLLCSEAQPSWMPTGMGPMYLLMTAFHLPPWLRLIGYRAVLRP